MFEDAPERAGISKRGPRKRAATSEENQKHGKVALTALAKTGDTNQLLRTASRVSSQPQSLSLFPAASTADVFLWECYVNRFCKTYPTFAEASNPFLTIIVPLALQYDSVKHAILAIAGLQLRDEGNAEYRSVARKHRAMAMSSCVPWWKDIAGGKLGSPKDSSSPSDHVRPQPEDRISLATTSILALLIAKLSGESYDTIQPFFGIVDQFLTESFLRIGHIHAANDFSRLHFDFLSRLYDYNRLLASLACNELITLKFDSTTLQTRSGSEQVSQTLRQQQMNFPSLLARISETSEYMSTLDLDMWMGDLNFLPSFSSISDTGLQPHAWTFFSDSVSNNMAGVDENSIIREVYRLTARIYLFQQLRDRPNLPNTLMTLSYPPFIAQEEIEKLSSFEVDLLKLLPAQSSVDTALLLPLGVAAPELIDPEERQFVIDKLQSLQNRLGFEHFGVLGKDLQSTWARKDGDRVAQQLDCVSVPNIESLISRLGPIRLWG